MASPLPLLYLPASVLRRIGDYAADLRDLVMHRDISCYLPQLSLFTLPVGGTAPKQRQLTPEQRMADNEAGWCFRLGMAATLVRIPHTYSSYTSIDLRTRRLAPVSNYTIWPVIRFADWCVDRDRSSAELKVISAIKLEDPRIESCHIYPAGHSLRSPLLGTMRNYTRMQRLPIEPIPDACATMLSLGDGILRFGYWGRVRRAEPTDAATTSLSPPPPRPRLIPIPPVWEHSANAVEVDAMNGRLISHVSAVSSAFQSHHSPGIMSEVRTLSPGLHVAFAFTGPELLIGGECVRQPRFIKAVRRSMGARSANNEGVTPKQIYFGDMFAFAEEETSSHRTQPGQTPSLRSVSPRPPLLRSGAFQEGGGDVLLQPLQSPRFVFLVANRTGTETMTNARFVLAKVERGGGATSMSPSIVYLDSCPAVAGHPLRCPWWWEASAEHRTQSLGHKVKGKLGQTPRRWGKRDGIIFRGVRSFVLDVGFGKSCVVELTNRDNGIAARIVDGFCLAPASSAVMRAEAEGERTSPHQTWQEITTQILAAQERRVKAAARRR